MEFGKLLPQAVPNSFTAVPCYRPGFLHIQLARTSSWMSQQAASLLQSERRENGNNLPQAGLIPLS